MPIHIHTCTYTQVAFKVSVENQHLMTPTHELIGRVVLRLSTVTIHTYIHTYIHVSNRYDIESGDFEDKKPQQKIYVLGDKDGLADGKERGVCMSMYVYVYMYMYVCITNVIVFHVPETRATRTVEIQQQSCHRE